MVTAIGRWLWARKWTILIIVAVAASLGAWVVALQIDLHRERAASASMADQLIESETVRQLGDGRVEILTAQLADLNDVLARKDIDFADALATGERVVSFVKTRIVYQPAVVDATGTVTHVPAVAGVPEQARVDFAAEHGPVAVVGYTLAPAGTAHLEWRVKDLEIDIVMSRDRSGRVHTRIDPHDQELTITAASTAIDPSVLDVQRRWYAAGTIAIGVPDWREPAVGVDAGYMYDRWSLGLAYLHDGTAIADGHRLGIRVGGRF